MSETFIALARTGNPNNRQIPRWEPYTLPRRKTLVFDVPSHLEDDPRGAERRLFAKVPYVQPGTLEWGTKGTVDAAYLFRLSFEFSALVRYLNVIGAKSEQ